MGTEEQILQEIVARIAAAARPTRVILYGSAAGGTTTPDSDIDLLVLEDQVEDTRRESVRLRAVLRGIEMPLDIAVMRTERFEETKHVVGGIAYPAHKYGKVIYDAA
jgi:predicted nucleotidyltransferase